MINSDNIDNVAQSFFIVLIFCSVMSDSYILFDNFLKNNYIKKKINYSKKIYKIAHSIFFNNYKKDNKGNIIIGKEKEKENNKNPFDEDIQEEPIQEEPIQEEPIQEEPNQKEPIQEEHVCEEHVCEEPKLNESIKKPIEKVKKIKNIKKSKSKI